MPQDPANGSPPAAGESSSAAAAGESRPVEPGRFAVGDMVWFSEEGGAAERMPYAEGVVETFTGVGHPVGVRMVVSGSDQPPRYLAPERLHLRNDPTAAPPDDHCGLVHLSEANLLANTLRRVLDGRFCTWVGPSQLVAVNPCETVPALVGEAKMRSFVGQRDALEPHAYAVAELACMSLHQHPRVAIMVSGESGAGKTENNRFIVEHLVWRCGGGGASGGGASGGGTRDAAGVREAVLQSATVLESLGNAAMTANPNSSRFGKFVSLLFTPAEAGCTPAMVGARVETFLLEKCRVAGFGRGQRNFHALYELAAAKPPCARAPRTPRAADEFFFLCDDVTRREHVHGATGRSDGSERSGHVRLAQPNAYPAAEARRRFDERLQAGLRALGASEAGLAELYAALRAVLLLGELSFAEDASDLVRGRDERG